MSDSKTVPRELTAQMAIAAMRTLPVPSSTTAELTVREIWQAAYDAAPAAPPSDSKPREPLGILWQHQETGRSLVKLADDAQPLLDGRWAKVGQVYLGEPFDAAPAVPGDARVSGTAAEYLPLHATDEKRLPGDARWIPVNERMPGNGEDVLAHWGNGITPSVNYWNAERKEWCDSYTHEWIEGNLTHWMPLPEPPK